MFGCDREVVEGRVVSSRCAFRIAIRQGRSHGTVPLVSGSRGSRPEGEERQ